ncbi:Sensor-type histidine kinase PrrB [Rhodococcus sp. RD6.2]|uniref:HAMP domain-containing sensor histidine kinase n=1 Tax=Rhodococcus sp. RD6.2 TaxID=260936 RepID=UPI00063BC56D|nr:HAMP domain-containing sensor histidine kinase [Rhodococcus sp. RD6.2]CRK49460.1 Sensor-type histidine kinase PrrB [Rhodococcus sp. RD6.2]
MRRSLSLRARVAIVSALSAAVVIVAIGAAIAVFLRVNGSEQIDRTLDSVTLAFPAELAPADTAMAPVLPLPSVVADGSTDPVEALATEDATRTELMAGTAVRVRDVAVPGESGAVLALTVPEDPLTQAIRQQQVAVAIAAVVAIAAAGGLGWLLAGRAVRPLRLLANATHEIGDDPGAPRPNVRGAREAEDLSEAMGHMLDRIAMAQRRTEEALGSARDFAAVSAHELRTPLTSMRTDLEVLATMRLTGEQRTEILDDLLDTQRQVETTLTGLERLALGELADASDHEDVDLVDLVDRCVQESARTHRDVDIDFAAPERAVVICGVPTGLRLVLDNAITNAVRHGGAHRIQVTIGCDPGGEVVLTVDDDGSGVPEAERVVVFDRFVRGRGAGADGSGLGLALVTQQAALHGGTVELEDSPLGGARLALRLPPGAELGRSPEL